MTDTFANHASGLTAPAGHAAQIVPNDGADLPVTTRAIYVGTGGDVRVRLISGATVTFTNMQAGLYYPMRVERVLATGTTAGGLVGMS